MIAERLSKQLESALDASESVIKTIAESEIMVGDKSIGPADLAYISGMCIVWLRSIRQTVEALKFIREHNHPFPDIDQIFERFGRIDATR